MPYITEAACLWASEFKPEDAWVPSMGVKGGAACWYQGGKWICPLTSTKGRNLPRAQSAKGWHWHRPDPLATPSCVWLFHRRLLSLCSSSHCTCPDRYDILSSKTFICLLPRIPMAACHVPPPCLAFVVSVVSWICPLFNRTAGCYSLKKKKKKDSVCVVNTEWQAGVGTNV